MSDERLTLVTDFDSLKAGDYVEGRDCRICGGTHRGILLGRIENSDEWEWEAGLPRKGWIYAPGGGHDVISAFSFEAVVNRRIYLIDTGLTASSSTTTTTKAPRRERA